MKNIQIKINLLIWTTDKWCCAALVPFGARVVCVPCRNTLTGSAAAAAHGKICGRETGRGAVFSRIRGERWAAMSHRPRGTLIASHMHMHAHAHAQARSSWTAVACGPPTLHYDLFSSVRGWLALDLLCQWLVEMTSLASGRCRLIISIKKCSYELVTCVAVPNAAWSLYNIRAIFSREFANTSVWSCPSERSPASERGIPQSSISECTRVLHSTQWTA